MRLTTTPGLPLQFWLIWFGMAILSGAILAAIAFVIYKLVDMGRSWIIEVPTTPGALANINRKALKAGQRYERASHAGQPGEKDAIIADPDASFPTLRGPLRLVHKETGYSLVAPRPNELPIALRELSVDADAEFPQLTPGFAKLPEADQKKKLEEAKAVTEKRLEENALRALHWLRMQVCTPLLFWKAIRTNDHQDFLDTQTPRPHWLVSAAPWLFIGLLATLAFLGFVLWQGVPGFESGAARGGR